MSHNHITYTYEKVESNKYCGEVQIMKYEGQMPLTKDSWKDFIKEVTPLYWASLNAQEQECGYWRKGKKAPQAMDPA